MKLVRYGPAGREKPGLIDADGKLRDLSRKVKDIDGTSLTPSALALLRKVDTKRLPLVKGRPRLGPCVANVGKFIAIGLNFADHARETNSPIPENPIVFFKSTTCIQGPNDPIMLPKDSTQTDWEVELGVVIGRRARYVEEKDALRYVAGYCLINDVSEREFQLKKGGNQWGKGKGCDTFGPIGPWLATADEIKDPQNLGMWLKVNGQTQAERQHEHDDLRRGEARGRRLALHDARAGRRDHHRHAARRRHGPEARAAVPEGRRRRSNSASTDSAPRPRRSSRSRHADSLTRRGAPRAKRAGIDAQRLAAEGPTLARSAWREPVQGGPPIASRGEGPRERMRAGIDAQRLAAEGPTLDAPPGVNRPRRPADSAHAARGRRRGDRRQWLAAERPTLDAATSRARQRGPPQPQPREDTCERRVRSRARATAVATGAARIRAMSRRLTSTKPGSSLSCSGQRSV